MRFLLFILAVTLCLGDDDTHYCQSLPPVHVDLPGYKLEYVQTVTRHGARTPIEVMPAIEEPMPEWNCRLHQLERPSQGQGPTENVHRLFRRTYRSGKETLKGNCSFGQLTDVGFRQHVQLGALFRQIYVDKLGLIDQSKGLSQVRVRSTDVYRTIQSAEAEITGMFPELKEGIEVLQIETTDAGGDDMVANPVLCPAFTREMQRVKNSAAWAEQQKKTVKLTKYLKTAFKVDSLFSWDGIYDIYQLRRCLNLPLPAAITPEIFTQVRLAAEWELNATTSDFRVAKTALGLFLKTIRDNIVDYVFNNKREVKYQLLSGHDSTIGPLLGLLGVFDGRWPPFASYINFELYSKGAQWFVQVKSNGKIFQFPGCGSSVCPWQAMNNYLAERIMTPAKCV